MKREGGLWATAAVLGIAATVGISTTKTTPPSPPTAAPKATKSYTRPSTPKMDVLDNGPCPDMEKLLQAFFLIDETEIIAPKSCYPDEANSAQLDRVLGSRQTSALRNRHPA